MNNTEKLLRAFIEASGYEIEVIEDIKRTYKVTDLQFSGEPKECAMPDSIIKTTDYKVTKSKLQQGLDDNKLSEPKYKVDITPIDELVKSILKLSEFGENLRFVKYKKYDFDRVVNWFDDLAKKQSDTYYLILDVEVLLDE